MREGDSVTKESFAQILANKPDRIDGWPGFVEIRLEFVPGKNGAVDQIKVAVVFVLPFDFHHLPKGQKVEAKMYSSCHDRSFYWCHRKAWQSHGAWKGFIESLWKIGVLNVAGRAMPPELSTPNLQPAWNEA